jgi:acyl transferase domain-containing protein/glutamate-1-semialdehyde aminotransferase
MSVIEQESMEAVAIIGMVGRLPGAPNLEDFWAVLRDGLTTISHFAPEQLASSVPEEDRHDPKYVRARGVLEGAELFDGAFFGMSPAECLVTDPQQRVFLEACWEALEHAGYAPDAVPGMVGVFGGMANNTYYPALLATRPDLVERFGALQTMLANEKDYLATRVAYKLGLTGPAVNVYSACSTSLLAICEAFHNLLAYRCDVAVAGGVTVTYPQERGYRYQAGAITSGDGVCRPFDEDAQGTVFGSGLGVVVLKRLSEALADDDTIYAVIKGVGVNNDGARRSSFSAPSVDGQAEAVMLAHDSAAVTPEDIGYVEAHGTATHLGDPIEIEALAKAFGSAPRRESRPVGSLKGNVGHLDAAAGVVGLLKTVLMLQHGQIPPVAHFKRPNSRIGFSATPFYVSKELHRWPDDLPRRAGVSSFGTGGTNAHVVIEDAPEQPASDGPRPYEVLCLSARSPTALDTATDRLANYLEHHPEANIADVAFTLQVGRTVFPHRRVMAVRDAADATTVLREQLPHRVVTRETATRPEPTPVVFMFPGQGSQYVGMGSNLYQREPVFRDAVDRCAQLFTPVIGTDIRTVLFPTEPGEAAAERLRQTKFSQSGLFTVQYALAQLWRSWGVEPSAMIGHSVGEFVAACLAGVFSLEDAARLVGTRAALMQDRPAGSMLSVRLAASAVAPRLRADCAIAAVNGPALCVVSGPTESIDALEQKLSGEEVMTRLLHTSHAFHSPMMDPVVEPFQEVVRSVRLTSPAIPFVSTVTADWITNEQALDPAYWARHLRETVRFAEGVAVLWNDAERILLEVGPRGTLTTLARQQMKDVRRQLAVPSLAERADDDSEWNALMLAVGQLWAAGGPIDWARVHGGQRRRRVALPTYPFERARYWIEPTEAQPNVSEGDIQRKTMPYSEEDGAGAPVAVMKDGRLDRVLVQVREELEATSGMAVPPDHVDATLLELGFDSLMLTQVSLALSKRFRVEISFRQLLEELSSPRLVAAHIDGVLLEEGPPAAPAPARPGTGLRAPGTVAPMVDVDSVERLIGEQLEIMRGQLEVLRAHGRSGTGEVRTVSAPQDGANGKVAGSADSSPAKPFGAAARIDVGKAAQLSPEQSAWINEFTARYIERTARSRSYTERHRPSLADPRVVSGFTPSLKELVYPIVVERAAGARLWDLDGNEYIDMVNGFGSNFLGHSAPVVANALAEQVSRGFAVGPQHPLAGEVAQLVAELTGLSRVAFCNTGSEAVLGAVRTARTVTGRSTIVMFRDAYHGIFDEVVVRGGTGFRSVPAAPGIPAGAVGETLVLDYGDEQSLDVIRERADSIAAVLVEPVQSRRLDLQPREFLHQLRKITSETGIALVFDEVITGFRVGLGGAQEYFGVRADLATYGKVVGGGLPIGVIAGAPRFMDALDGGQWSFGDDSFPTVGVTYFAGTFVRHPLALTAAYAVLTHLRAEGDALQQRVNRLTDSCVTRLRSVCDELGAPVHLAHFSSALQLSFNGAAPLGPLLFPLLRAQGVHMFDGRTWFLTAAHTASDVDFVVEAFRHAMTELLDVGLVPRVGRSAANDMAALPTGDPTPPAPNARLGRNPAGQPGWYVPDPNRPGKYLLVEEARS